MDHPELMCEKAQ